MSQTERWARYADFYRSSPYASFPQQHRSTSGRLAFQMIDVMLDAHEFFDPDVPELIITLMVDSSDGAEFSWNLGDGWRRECAAPGQLLVVPENCASAWAAKGSRRLLLLAIPTRTIQQILGCSMPRNLADAMRPLSEAAWNDELVGALMWRLWQSSCGEHLTDWLLADGAIVTLVAHLAQRADAVKRPMKQFAISPSRLRRVREYVDANLQEQLDITALAEVAGLSVRHFARAFQHEVGQTPHRWLMNRRTERAIALMADENLPLAQIASSCGFAGQSHFTKVFRELTGKTPRKWAMEEKSIVA